MYKYNTDYRVTTDSVQVPELEHLRLLAAEPESWRLAVSLAKETAWESKVKRGSLTQLR